MIAHLRLVAADWRSRLGMGIVGFFVLFAIAGPLLFPGDPNRPDYTIRPNQPPMPGHWLGTDQGGRDIFLQLVHGAAPSLTVAAAVGLLATVLAVAVGVVAGAAGRLADSLLTLLTNVFLLIPGLPLVIIVASYVETRSNWPIIAILALTGWAWGARTLRSQAMSLRNRDFVLAAVTRGEPGWRVVLVEILPNMISLLVTIFIGSAAGSMAAMSGLQFLGLGDISEVNWFTSLYWAQNYGAVLTGAWWTFIPAGLAIALTVTGLSLINYGIDAINNPQLRVVSRRRAPAVEASADVDPGAALLAVRGLSVEYQTAQGPSRVVDDVSFDVAAGEVLGIAGESGSGKSTIVSALLRIGPPTMHVGGGARFSGIDLLAIGEEELRTVRWERVALVSQSSMNALSPVHTIGRHFVDTIRSHRRWSRARCLARAGELLTLVGMDQARLKAYPHELSGGMRQRVMIALALALEPELLVLDEPTTALDVVVQREIVQQLTDLQQNLGFAIVFISHDLALLLEASDRVAIMKDGRIVEIGASTTLRDEAADPYARLLVDAVMSLPATAGGHR